MTSDINQVQNGINMTLRLLLRSPFVVFGAMVMALQLDAHTADGICSDHSCTLRGNIWYHVDKYAIIPVCTETAG